MNNERCRSGRARRSRLWNVAKAPFALAALFTAFFDAGVLRGQTATACAGPQGGAAGVIQGSVIDPSSAVVPGATVTLECGGVETRRTPTSAAGRYRLDAPAGSYNLVLEKQGFETFVLSVSVAAGQRLEENVTLEVTQVSDAITVTAGGFEQLVRNAPASVSVLPQEDLRTKRFASLAQALIDIEGVDVGQDVGKTGGMTISMRGMPSDYTLMLIDGKRQNPGGNVTPNGFTETGTSFMPPIGAVERIEVVRGPMSTPYGSDAMGGVVNVITRKVSERWTGSVTLDGTLQENTDYGKTGGGNFYVTGPMLADRLGVALRGSTFHREART